MKNRINPFLAPNHQSGVVVVLAAMCVAMLAVGCAPRVYSPPVRTAGLSSPATVGDGRVGVQVSGSHPVAGIGSDPGSPPETAGVRVRYGLAPKVDLLVEGGGSYANNWPQSDAFDILAIGGAAGLKYRFAEFAAVDAGLGFGGSKVGGFLGPDIGIVVGYENELFVPFLGFHFGLSIPVFSNELTGTSTPFPSGTPEEYAVEPQLTTYTTTEAGFRLQLGDSGGFHGNLLAC
ncbi:MAG: hypothetical protein KC417_13890, partial [Myxococcales bacterium]|nr:hypothetical protein [Myxococcales bacterium]